MELDPKRIVSRNPEVRAGALTSPPGAPPPVAGGGAPGLLPIWTRVILCAVGLGIILAAAAVVGHDEKLVDLYKTLLRAFDLLLGAFIGLLTGEALTKKKP